MSSRKEAIGYAVKKIPDILPLEEQEIKDLCNQILDNNNSPDSIAEAFFNILGQEDLSFEFVFGFNDLLNQNKEGVLKESKETFTKTSEPTTKIPFTSKATEPENPIETPLVQIAKPQIQEIKVTRKTVKPSPAKKQVVKEQPKTSKQRKLNSLVEIEDAVKYLTAVHEEKDADMYRCSCQGKIHPIFSLAPNCLSCGKIICVREGLHLNNCTFCGAELLPVTERMELVKALKEEEDSINNGTDKPETIRETKRKPAKTYKISNGNGKNLFDQQDKLFDFIERQKERERKREEVLRERDEQEKMRDAIETKAKEEAKVDKDLRAAQERLENLLHFQDTSAERTKVIDNATDYSISNDTGLWGSAREKALLLKKQQRNLRKWEKLERERNGRRDKYVVSMEIGPDGKVVMKEKVKDHGKVYAGSDDELDNISDEEDARDLQDIHAYKDELSSERELSSANLQSKVWDYEKDKKQYERPVYIGTDNDEDSENEDETIQKPNWQPRVQVNNSNDGSVEQNILAVL